MGMDLYYTAHGSIYNSKQDEPTTHIDTIQTLSLYKNSMLSLKMLSSPFKLIFEISIGSLPGSNRSSRGLLLS